MIFSKLSQVTATFITHKRAFLLKLNWNSYRFGTTCLFGQVCFVIDAVDTLRTFLAGFAAVTCFTSTAALGAGPATATAGVDALPLRHVTLQPLPAAVAHAQTLAVLSVPAAQHRTRHCRHQRMQVGKQMRGAGRTEEEDVPEELVKSSLIKRSSGMKCEIR